jgi:hypothetical protein
LTGGGGLVTTELLVALSENPGFFASQGLALVRRRLIENDRETDDLAMVSLSPTTSVNTGKLRRLPDLTLSELEGHGFTDC